MRQFINIAVALMGLHSITGTTPTFPAEYFPSVRISNENRQHSCAVFMVVRYSQCGVPVLHQAQIYGTSWRIQCCVIV
eukprot:m.135464 g.135464  ORF g.135464 m.135464 type:complete len:78 (+) comp29796_c1_seq1:1355-1588(+)